MEEILDFFKVFAKDKRFEDCKPMILEESKKGAVKMCTVMDYAERQGKRKGRREGRRQGKRQQAIETARIMIRDGETLEKIVRYTMLPEEKVRKLQEEKK